MSRRKTLGQPEDSQQDEECVDNSNNKVTEKNPEKMGRVLRILLAIKNIFYKKKCYKSEFWRHKIASWYIHAIEGTIINFVYALGIKWAIQFTFSMLRYRKGLFKSVRNLVSLDTLLFGAFCGGFVGVFRTVLWNLRKFRNTDDGINPAVAGFLASLLLAIDRSKNRRIQIASYMFARSFDSISKNIEKSSTYAKFAEHFGYGKQEADKNENQENKQERARHETSGLETTWVMFLSWAMTMYVLYTWVYEIDWFPHGVEKAMRVMIAPTPNEWNMVDKIGRVYGHQYLNSPMITSRFPTSRRRK